MERFKVLIIKEYYMDGIGQNIYVVYPETTLALTDEEAERLMDELRDEYHLVLQFHLDGSTELQIHEHN